MCRKRTAKALPIPFLPCESQHATRGRCSFLFFLLVLCKLLSASVRRKELPLESRRCVVRHASRAYVPLLAQVWAHSLRRGCKEINIDPTKSDNERDRLPEEIHNIDRYLHFRSGRNVCVCFTSIM